jgi:uncharacterized protein
MPYYNPAIRNELMKIIERLPLDTISKIKEYVEAILPSVKPVTLQAVRERRNEILSIAEKYGMKDIEIFGSVIRGEAKEKSDIDFLVNLDSGRSLLDLAGFAEEVEELLGYKIDVALKNSLKERIKDNILKEAVKL